MQETPPTPPVDTKHAPVAPKRPVYPSWWRSGAAPYIALICAAAAADFLMPKNLPGIGCAIGCIVLTLALLVQRRDWSASEVAFLILLCLVNTLALAVSGSGMSILACVALPFVMVLLPQRVKLIETLDTPTEAVKNENWWGFWARRQSQETTSRLSKIRHFLPMILSIVIGVIFFITFLTIFASGNEVVRLVWEYIAEKWNELMSYFKLDWDFFAHALRWFIGVLLFGVYTLERMKLSAFKAPAEVVLKYARPMLPHLPLILLLGTNLAFLVATSTDIAYLWMGCELPQGVSQTAYLHEGAYSVSWAAALASFILIILFRTRGSVRESRVGSALGYLLLLQCLMLALSVYLRLYNQIGDFGFTVKRVMAAESMLLGLAGFVILALYMLRSGRIISYIRLCSGTLVLMVLSFTIIPPSVVAPMLNKHYMATHPKWSFEPEDFSYGRFDARADLGFAHMVLQNYPENEDMKERVENAAKSIERFYKDASWTDWTFIRESNRRAAEEILGYPVELKKD